MADLSIFASEVSITTFLSQPPSRIVPLYVSFVILVIGDFRCGLRFATSFCVNVDSGFEHDLNVDNDVFY